MQVCDSITTDRGSKCAVSGAACTLQDDARTFIKELCCKKKFARATHNTWAETASGTCRMRCVTTSKNTAVLGEDSKLLVTVHAFFIT